MSRKRIKQITERGFIEIMPDRPDIWEKAGFRVKFNLGKKTYERKFTIGESGKLEFFTDAPKKSKLKETNHVVYIPQNKINLHTLYHAEGECEFYSASFFGGEIHTQLIPLFKLADFLEEQIKLDAENGQFYDLINLRENGREMWGQGAEYRGEMFRESSDSAEELLEKLMQYKRHGALIGEGGSFEYIQVCFIQLA